jgi:hypothetical protein
VPLSRPRHPGRLGAAITPAAPEKGRCRFPTVGAGTGLAATLPSMPPRRSWHGLSLKEQREVLRAARRRQEHPDARIADVTIQVAGAGGVQGWPVIASRRAVRMSSPCLRTVEM